MLDEVLFLVFVTILFVEKTCFVCLWSYSLKAACRLRVLVVVKKSFRIVHWGVPARRRTRLADSFLPADPAPEPDPEPDPKRIRSAPTVSESSRSIQRGVLDGGHGRSIHRCVLDSGTHSRVVALSSAVCWIAGSIDRSLDRSLDRSIDRSLDRSIDRSIDRRRAFRVRCWDN